DEPRVRFPVDLLGLGDHAPGAAPGLLRPVLERLEHALGSLRSLMERLGLRELDLDLTDEHAVLRDANDVVDTVRLAPHVELVARKARVAADDETHLREGRPDTAHDPFDDLDRMAR